MKPLITLQDISMVFDIREGFFGEVKKLEAVSKLNLHIYPGEILAVVGESGCGKTTLGKVLCGLYKATSGSMYYEDQDVTKLFARQFKEYRNNVQMVHQDSYAALNPVRTIFQSLSAPILRKGIAKNKSEARKMIMDLLVTVGLTPPDIYIDKYPHQLSGGQRQRILLARAISLRPKLIIADEPVSMVDVSIRISILNLMSRLNKELNIGFIYITHDLATARYIASNGRIAVMYLGKIIEVGKLNEVFASPRHPYLQALLSAVPVPNPKFAKSMKPLPLRSLEMPDPTDPPKGCRFEPRCPYAKEICKTEEPILREVDGINVSCHLIEDIPTWRFTDTRDA